MPPFERDCEACEQEAFGDYEPKVETGIPDFVRSASWVAHEPSKSDNEALQWELLLAGFLGFVCDVHLFGVHRNDAAIFCARTGETRCTNPCVLQTF